MDGNEKINNALTALTRTKILFHAPSCFSICELENFLNEITIHLFSTRIVFFYTIIVGWVPVWLYIDLHSVPHYYLSERL